MQPIIRQGIAPNPQHGIVKIQPIRPKIMAQTVPKVNIKSGTKRIKRNRQQIGGGKHANESMNIKKAGMPIQM